MKKNFVLLTTITLLSIVLAGCQTTGVENMTPQQEIEKQMEERMNLKVHIPEHPKYVIRTAGFHHKYNSDFEPTNELNNLAVEYSLKTDERLNIDRVQPGFEAFIDEQYKTRPVIFIWIGPGMMEKPPYIDGEYHDGEFKVGDKVVFYDQGQEMYGFEIQFEDRWFHIHYELIDNNTFEDAKEFVVNFVEEN
jgi:hypothetical protein